LVSKGDSGWGGKVLDIDEIRTEAPVPISRTKTSRKGNQIRKGRVKIGGERKEVT